ncbi:MAG TPA: hypothetical protein VEF53_08745 [Patescibacteria group bacterium]|nr:hypothetical protein [Patescibacteria group bacterium]
MLQNLYYFEKLIEIQQKEVNKKSREAWMYLNSREHGSTIFTKAMRLLNIKKNINCVACCC